MNFSRYIIHVIYPRSLGAGHNHNQFKVLIFFLLVKLSKFYANLQFLSVFFEIFGTLMSTNSTIDFIFVFIWFEVITLKIRKFEMISANHINANLFVIWQK